MKSLVSILVELTFPQMFKETPAEYIIRGEKISVRLKTIKSNRYYYETLTPIDEKGGPRKHQQIIMPVPKKIAPKKFKVVKIESIKDHIGVQCDCGNFRYENEWILWKNNAANIYMGNKKPLVVRNPRRLRKLCKHLVAVLKDFQKRVKN